MQLSKDSLEAFGAESKFGTSTRVPYLSGVAVVVGVGDGLKTDEDFRRIGGVVSRALPPHEVFCDVNGWVENQVLAFIEGLQLGSYRQPPKAKTENSKSVVLIGASVPKKLMVRAQNDALVVNKVRDWVNTPANQLNPVNFAKIAKSEAIRAGIKAEIWDEKRLLRERCGGILGVGAGSSVPPRLVKLSYGRTGPLLSLVGKGITFDTGGLSIKPPEAMVGMKYDMAGAASILGAALLIANRQLPIRLEAYLCLAENMPSGSATRPGDVLEIRNGKTVEVLNTDAEGRLVMADGLSIASEAKPDLLIDVATLTGAAGIALGNRYAGLMGSETAVQRLLAAAGKSGELLWHMPLPEELRALLDTESADLANVKIGNRSGGMLIAGIFLREFVAAGIDWAHIDIASSANNPGPAWGHVPSGASGVVVRTLLEAASGLSHRR